MPQTVANIRALIDTDDAEIIAFLLDGSLPKQLKMAALLGTMMTTEQDKTVAWLNANNGDYDGQLKRITDAGGNCKPWVEWSAADACWYPHGGKQPLNIAAPQGTIAAAVNQSINLLNPGTANPLVLAAGLLVLKSAAPNLGLLIDQRCELNIAPTAMTHVCTINDGAGAASWVNWTGTTSRRLSRFFSIRCMGSASVQRSSIKDNNNEYSPGGNINSNTDILTKNAALAWTISNIVTYTNSSATANLSHCNVWLTRGGDL